MAQMGGVFRLAGSSRWRQRRLLILCYHGVSLEDEHEWNPSLYMPPPVLERRFALLKENGCRVLPLDEAVRRLYRNDLPPNSVALTFDDGTHDFYLKAYPLLKSFGFPATVYLTTWYCGRGRPVFNPAFDYLLWKARGAVPETRDRARCELARGLSGDAKDELLEQLARVAGVDYCELTRKRLLQIMSPDEVRELAGAGVDFQLHTHRHWTPDDRSLFLREIRDNRERLRALTGCEAVHFCYPSGEYQPEFFPWLAGESIASATTCEPGLASVRSNPLLLPRLVDHCGLNEVEFVGWLSGCSAFLPARHPALHARSRECTGYPGCGPSSP
jgi:peptidoglycan/xylan/chitin deacetylase (PgdA/CDA1 family)